jgi:parallel beta-helix repeat protein
MRATLNAVILCALVALPGAAFASPTYYVDGATGDDARTASQAMNPATPWKTIKKAVSAGGLIGMTNKGVVLDGYTVVVAPGVYTESVESKRDGLSAAPVVIKAASAGAVTIRPPAGQNGIFISHHHHVIEGFVVTGGTVGIRFGAHDGGDGPVNGLVARHNRVFGNSNNGIQFMNAQNCVAASNTVHGNGLNGLNYSGNGSVIHDNVVYDNANFGVYVRDGINHQVWNNTAHGNPNGDIKILGSQVPPPGGRTFFVGPAGSDTASDVQAQSAATPWRTFFRALQGMQPGDTLLILPGVYTGKLESVRDGRADAPISIRAAEPGSVTIQPSGGSAVYIGHNHHALEGLAITGAATGLQLGPYKQTGGVVHGLAVRHNEVYGNGVGIKLNSVTSATATHNVVWSNAKDGIAYTWANQGSCPPGSGATIFNNLVYGNGSALTGEYGITVGCGDRNEVANNTLHGNANGGIRMGVAGDVPVSGSVVNNIVVGSPVGVKEPAGSNYTGRIVLDFNNVWGNALNYALGPLSRPGTGSISATPGFVDAASADFRLGRLATGQAADSPCIDKGSDTADAVGLAGLTAFTDKSPDAGRVDLGYHGTLLYPSEGRFVLNELALTIGAGAAAELALSGRLTAGPESDGMRLGLDRAEVVVGDLAIPLWPAGFRAQGDRWTFVAGTGAVHATLARLDDGSVRFGLHASGLAIEAVRFPTTATVRIGDDYASIPVLLQGVLRAE